ncbi:amino acid/polyamine/organocation transporter (APC superfamily) [Murinocardiopsis flavida]|uniref:Amino acid/polyamine/organocation transporter (APC superfamily) n=1 Tax=Murinocardiopsis flavida TaxID=645275 RepID=A0A2P8DP66_9ACTN|nr:amino acid/polyamine/organocation transporter (APC superfamily) [Murinocardiopsis flavida]
MLGAGDATLIGAGAMIGAGVFAVFAPAAHRAGVWLPVAMLIAAVVAYCNATSSARLAARHAESGGTYVYGRERLGEVWGYLAGWSFVVGKVASCAVMALTFAAYVLPGYERAVAVSAVVVLTAVNYVGLRRSLAVTRVLLAGVLLALGAVVVAAWTGGGADPARLDLGADWPGFFGLFGAAGMVFFAFAGYARVSTLAGEVRDARVIPRAVTASLVGVLLVYLAVGVSALAVLGPRNLARSVAPVEDLALASAGPWLVWVVAVGAAMACLGALLSLVLGVSRTVLAMSADGHLPRALASIHPRFGVPHRAELAVGAVVVVLVLSVDLRGAIGFSAFGVLVYYAIANASALRLGPEENRPPLLVPIVGLVGCVVLALSLPTGSVLVGAAVLAVGAGVWLGRHWWSGRASAGLSGP